MTGASTTAIRRAPLLGLMKLDATEADLDAALRAIEKNDPPFAIRRYFRKFQHAVEFYAKVRAFQFSVPNRPAICCDCQAAEGEIVAELCWASVFSRFSAWTLLTILTVWHQKRQKRIRQSYYAEMAMAMSQPME
jgi:hypothetical protein